MLFCPESSQETMGLLVVQHFIQHLFQKIPSHSKTGNHSTYHKNAATSGVGCGSSSTAQMLGTRREGSPAEAIEGTSGTDPGRDSSRLSRLAPLTPTGCSAGPDLGPGFCISCKEEVILVHLPFTPPSGWTDLVPPQAGQWGFTANTHPLAQAARLLPGGIIPHLPANPLKGS